MIKQAVSSRWMCDASDDYAVSQGCWFNERIGQAVVDWLYEYLRLYEGSWAGERFQCKDWQYDATMRLFGWMRHDEELGKTVRRFRQSSIWIPKKNKKSPTLAAWGLYLLCGDGEQGQKVFFGAADGQQAREIAGTHAVEMIKQSEELMGECSINKTRMAIEHCPTRSFLRPLASADVRSQRAQEGLNGSILIDETHVVDRRFIARVSRMGISRDDPLHIDASTVGNDMTSYGRSRYEYAKSVAEGTVLNDEIMVVIKEAPQDLSDADLDSDPVKYGRLANPAWGHTIREREFLNDYRESCKSVSDMADFKMYRLNIWQASRNPWLKKGDWQKCQVDRKLEDYYREKVWLGLDKSKTTDMTALVLAFKEDEDTLFQWPYFWLPENPARSRNNLAAYLDWANGGYLELIPGDVIINQPIQDRLAMINQCFKVQYIFYDKTYAEDLTLWAEEELGIDRVEFSQSAKDMAPAVDDYERLVIQGKLLHPGNKVLDWQAGHCETRPTSQGRRVLAKPDREDHKKIDGIVAGVMAVQGPLYYDDKDKPSIYEDGGLREKGPLFV